MSGPVAVLDACVLVPIRLATTLLWVAEAGLFQPQWSAPILDEVSRALPKVGVSPEDARRRVGMMRDAFGAEALVDGFEDLIDEMGCHPKDRHVLAAGVRGGVDTIVTFNLKDFPDEAAALHGIEILHPDSFLIGLFDRDPETVISALERQAAAFRHPPQTIREFLAGLTATVPTFADLAAGTLVDRPGQGSSTIST